MRPRAATEAVSQAKQETTALKKLRVETETALKARRRQHDDQLTASAKELSQQHAARENAVPAREAAAEKTNSEEAQRLADLRARRAVSARFNRHHGKCERH